MAEAQYALGARLKEGLEGAYYPNPTEALEHLARAAGKGHAKANYAVGCMLESGTGVPAPDIPGAQRHFEVAAAAGDVKAAVNLGRLCEKSEVAHLHGQAAKWYARASEAGDPTAAFNLSMLHASGTGGAPKAPLKELEFLRLAVARGSPRAQYNLATKMLRGEGVPRDEEGALKLLEAADAAGVDDKSARMIRRIMRARKERAHAAAEEERVRREREAAAEEAEPETTTPTEAAIERVRAAAAQRRKDEAEAAEAAAAEAAAAEEDEDEDDPLRSYVGAAAARMNTGMPS